MADEACVADNTGAAGETRVADETCVADDTGAADAAAVGPAATVARTDAGTTIDTETAGTRAALGDAAGTERVLRNAANGGGGGVALLRFARGPGFAADAFTFRWLGSGGGSVRTRAGLSCLPCA